MRLSRAGWAVMTFLSLVVVLVASRYLQFDPSTYFEEQREVYVDRQTVLGLHIGGAMLALTTGPFQFARRLRTRHPRVHRTLGVLYVTGGTVGGVFGVMLATTAHGGLSSTLAFTGLGLASLFTTWTAVRMILAGRVQEHRRWMIRSFALTLAAVTLRLYLGAYAGLAAAGLVSVDFTTAYVAIAWLCWVPNLVIAVLITRPSTPVRERELVLHR